MPTYTFKKDSDPNNEFDNTEVEVVIRTHTLPDIIEAFESFLTASGFILGGTLEVVSNTTEDDE